MIESKALTAFPDLGTLLAENQLTLVLELGR
jgi:hypothetical protein